MAYKVTLDVLVPEEQAAFMLIQSTLDQADIPESYNISVSED